MTGTDAAGRSRYAAELRDIGKGLPRLRDVCRDDGRLERISRCIEWALADIEWTDRNSR